MGIVAMFSLLNVLLVLGVVMLILEVWDTRR